MNEIGGPGPRLAKAHTDYDGRRAPDGSNDQFGNINGNSPGRRQAPRSRAGLPATEASHYKPPNSKPSSGISGPGA